MMRSGVSIVVPAHDAEATLPLLLAALVAQVQARGDAEVVVVDSASLDRTYELALGAAVRTIREPRLGASAARNAGLRVAGGELVAFLDSDCIPQPGWLERLVARFEQNHRIGAVGGHVAAAPARRMLQRHAERAGYYVSQEVALADPFLPFVLTANCCYRREVLDRFGGFDETLRSGEDTQLAWRMQLELDLEVAFARDAVVEHVHRSTLAGIWKQWARYGYGEVQLSERFRNRAAPMAPSRRQVLRLLSEVGASVRALGRVPVGRADALDVAAPLLRCYEAAATRSGRMRARRDLCESSQEAR